MATLVTDALSWWVRARPDAAAFVLDDDVVTYRELAGWSDRVAERLRDQYGVSVGDVVSIAGANSLEWVAGALGVAKVGAIVNPVNTRFTRAEVARLVADARPRLVIADGPERSKFGPPAGWTLLDMDDVVTWRHEHATAVRADVDPTAPLVLAYTSGTTADPKGLVYSHENVLGSLFELVLKDPLPPDDARMLLALPLSSVGGVVHAVLHTVARGATTVLMRRFEPADALGLLVRHRISMMNGVPTIYEMIARQPAFDGLDLSHLRSAQVGGARVSTQLLQAWIARGVALRHIYGMTEIGGHGTVPRPDDAVTAPELCGDGSIFTEVRTVRPDGTFCDPGEAGEIVMRGPGRMVGYWNDPEATERVVVDGWLRSGDLGVIDERGYLRYIERLKDLVITGGYNVAPSEVEAVIAEVTGVHEVAVIAVADETWGEVPAAIVNGSPDLTETVILDHARRHLTAFKVPKHVVITVEPLPRLVGGKVAKRVLRERYASLGRR